MSSFWPWSVVPTSEAYTLPWLTDRRGVCLAYTSQGPAIRACAEQLILLRWRHGGNRARFMRVLRGVAKIDQRLVERIACRLDHDARWAQWWAELARLRHPSWRLALLAAIDHTERYRAGRRWCEPPWYRSLGSGVDHTALLEVRMPGEDHVTVFAVGRADDPPTLSIQCGESWESVRCRHGYAPGQEL